MNYQASPISGQQSGKLGSKAPWKKALWLALFLMAALCLVYLSPLRNYLSHIREVSHQIQSLGPWAPICFGFGVAILVAVGFPRLLFCVISGMALGFWMGFIVAQTGTLIGNYLTFIFVRWSGRERAEQCLAQKGFVSNFIHREGVASVIIARQLPIPGLLLNLAFGLSPLRHRHFLIGTLLGQIPEAIPCTLIGAGMLQASFSQSLAWIALSVVALLLAWITLKWLHRRLSSNNIS